MMDLLGIELIVAERPVTREQMKLVLGYERHQRAGAPAHRAIAGHDRAAQVQLDLVLDVATVTRPSIRLALAHPRNSFAGCWSIRYYSLSPESPSARRRASKP